MKYIIFLLLMLFALGQLGRISFFDQTINIYLYETALLIFLFLAYVKYKFEPLLKLWKASKAPFIFFAVLILSIFVNFQRFSLFQNLVGLMYVLRLLFYVSFGVYLSYWLRKTKKNDLISKGLTIFSVITIITTIGQYFFYPDLRNLFYLGWDPHLFRSFGVFFDTAISGSIYGTIFLTTANPLIRLVFLTFLVLNFSRSVYLALFVTLVYLVIVNKKYLYLAVVLIIFSVILFIAPKPFGEGVNLSRTFSVMSRIEDYKEGLSLFLKNPIIGYGYNRIRFIRGDFSGHSASAFSSSFLTILVGAGLIGLISFLNLLQLVWKRSKKFRHLILFIGVVSLFDNVMLHPFILFLLAFILADK